MEFEDGERYVKCRDVKYHYTFDRILLQNSTHLYARPLELHVIIPKVGGTTEWTRHVVGVPVGVYRVIFAFRMGYSFECAVALDDVQMVSCTHAGNWSAPENITGGID